MTGPNNQLYLTTSSPKPADQLLNANPIYNTCTPPIHAPTPYHPHSCITVPPNHPYYVNDSAPVTTPATTNTVMTIPCTLPCSRNYLFEPLEQNCADHPVHCRSVIINAANDNLPVHLINRSDCDVVPQVPLGPVLLISPVPHLCKIALTLVRLDSSSNEHTALATIIVKKSKSRWRRCYATVSLNLVLALGLALS